MDPETTRKIQTTVIQILKSSDIDSITEKKVRQIAAEKLALDLSDLPHKILVRQVIESFLLSTPDADNAAVGTAKDGVVLDKTTPVVSTSAKDSSGDSCRVICKLSQKRDVAIRSSGGKTLVSIRELFWKDGKQVPSSKCISLFPDQWSTFRKSIPAIEEAITKVESRLRSGLEKKEADDRHDRSENRSKQNVNRQSRHQPIHKDGTHCRPGPLAIGKRVEDASTVASTAQRLVPIEIIRFDGENYQRWADRMESYLNQLRVAYVLSDPCPSAVGVIDAELGQTLSAVEKWVDDDHVCRQNILNSLCDNLFGHYSKKTGSAKDLWEELKHIYLYKEHGVKVSLVKKYIEFQMVEEKSVFDQVQELHQIADSLTASGMHVEEKFHVNVIISKLPPSWKPYSIQLMQEDYIPVWMLMNHLKAEEESRHKGKKVEDLLPRAGLSVLQPAKKLGPHRVPMKRPRGPVGNPEADREKKVKFCHICRKKGHFPEQCWCRNNEKDTLMGDMDGAAGHGTS